MWKRVPVGGLAAGLCGLAGVTGTVQASSFREKWYWKVVSETANGFTGLVSAAAAARDLEV